MRSSVCMILLRLEQSHIPVSRSDSDMPLRLGGARVVFPWSSHGLFPGPWFSWFWEAWTRNSYHSTLGTLALHVRRLDSADEPLVFGWPQLGLISRTWFPSWSGYILELKFERERDTHTHPKRNLKVLDENLSFFLGIPGSSSKLNFWSNQNNCFDCLVTWDGAGSIGSIQRNSSWFKAAV